MPTHDGGGSLAWARRWWRPLLAELVSTALLVWLGVAAAVAPGAPLAHPAMAFGFVVVGNAVAFGPVSGAHMNPAVSLAAALAGRLPPGAALAYGAAQTAGALLGFLALAGTLPLGAAGGLTLPAEDVGAGAAAALEAALTGLLALACLGVWAAPPDAAAPVKLGLVVAGLVYAGGAATGASINPARSLAPALYHTRWEHHWVYWVGPLGGAAAAALLHRLLAAPSPAPAPAPPAELLPLADKP